MIKVLYSTMIVKNLKESVSFYRDVLGFEEGYHVDLPNGASITIMNSKGASVELIEGKGYDIGLYSIGSDVEDLDPNGVRLCSIEHTKEYKESYMK